MTIGGVDSSGMLSVEALRTMDIETAMMAVQGCRANLLESNLKTQMEGVQARNNKIAKLNDLLGNLNKAAAKFNGDAKADTQLKDAAGSTSAGESSTDIWNSAVSADVSDSFRVYDNSTKADIDGWVQKVKSMIDSESNSQQMDMLRLQSLTNKRNEAYEVMSNFMKKMADSRSSILSTWR